MKRIAIQGYHHSFHEIAAHQFFKEEDVKIIPCMSFDGLFDSIHSAQADFGIVAIENTLVGSILSNYTRLRESNLSIRAEHKIRVKHSLLALAGQKIEDIKEVHSHPMALQQCEVFFKKYPHIKLINSDDTAYSAYEISQNKIVGRAAISNEIAAGGFDLNILASGIETNKRNFTRFLLVSNIDDTKSDLPNKKEINKASWVVTLSHRSGSLAQLLTVLSAFGISLTKIQSLPLVGQEWTYLFYIDMVFDKSLHYTRAVQCIGKYVEDLRILGEYTAALNPIEQQQISSPH
ncbi:MAG: prephenate dehydratase [Bacteroidetes bacterium]|nr:prephenate dehydratase [Bacteroidota bacterium]